MSLVNPFFRGNRKESLSALPIDIETDINWDMAYFVFSRVKEDSIFFTYRINLQAQLKLFVHGRKTIANN